MSTYRKREQTHVEFVRWLADCEKTARKPVCDIAAERAILAGILILGAAHTGGASSLVRELAEVAPPEAFFSTLFREVWQTLCNLACQPEDAPSAFDIPMVHGDLSRRRFGDGNPLCGLYRESLRELEEALGLLKFTEWDVSISATGVRNHAKTVGLLHRQRELQKVVREIDAKISIGLTDEAFTAETTRLFEAAGDASRISTDRGWQSSHDVSVSYFSEIVDGARKRRAGLKPAATGILALDDHIGGLMPGDLIVIGARPGMGKTALAVNNFAVSAAEQGHSVAVFSLEMKSEQLAGRLVGARAGVPLQSIRNGFLSKADWGAMTTSASTISKLPLFFDDRGSPTIDAVYERLHRLRQHLAREGLPPLGLVALDYLQLMALPEDERNTARAIQTITSRAKGLAKELGIPFVLLSQLNRSVEARPNKRPVCSDLRESGAIEQDADIIIFPYRDAVYSKNGDPASELIIAKFRNGETGTIDVLWDGPRTRFHDVPGGYG